MLRKALRTVRARLYEAGVIANQVTLTSLVRQDRPFDRACACRDSDRRLRPASRGRMGHRASAFVGLAVTIWNRLSFALAKRGSLIE